MLSRTGATFFSRRHFNNERHIPDSPRAAVTRCSLGILVLLLAAAPEASAQSLIEVLPGDYPVVLSAPHGGYLQPDSLSDRTCAACVTVRDSRTQEWARALREEIRLLTGRTPFVVISLLARTKLDPNRDVVEAADGDPIAAGVWADYHEAIEQATSDIEFQFGRGLVLDLHGHGHSILRFELGYLLSASTLRLPDAELDARAGQSSVLRLASEGHALSDIVRGPRSLGELLVTYGIPAVPSASDPAPMSGEAFFSGGYITARHGSRDGGRVDAVQLEAHFSGARDSDHNVAELARAVAAAVLDYIRIWYGDTSSTHSARHPQEGTCLTPRSSPSGILLRSDCAAGRTRVRIYDVLGRAVWSGDIERGGQVAISNLSAGVYFVAQAGGTPASSVVVRTSPSVWR